MNILVDILEGYYLFIERYLDIWMEICFIIVFFNHGKYFKVVKYIENFENETCSDKYFVQKWNHMNFSSGGMFYRMHKKCDAYFI